MQLNPNVFYSEQTEELINSIINHNNFSMEKLFELEKYISYSYDDELAPFINKTIKNINTDILNIGFNQIQEFIHNLITKTYHNDFVHFYDYQKAKHHSENYEKIFLGKVCLSLLRTKTNRLVILFTDLRNKPSSEEYKELIKHLFALLLYLSLKNPNYIYFKFFIRKENEKKFDSSKNKIINEYQKRSEEYVIISEILENFIVEIIEKNNAPDFEKLKNLYNKLNTRDFQFIKELRKIVFHIEGTETILLLGEKGTGKSELAKIIHSLGDFKGTFVDKSFAEIKEGELEGWEKGAFTGANYNYIGLLEQSNNGVFFLDELDRSTPMERNLILRFLQNKEIRRRAGKENRSVKTKIILGTNKNLEDLIRKNEFEEDFYDRIKELRITIPPLRKRKNDISILANYIITGFEKDNNYKMKTEKSIYNYLSSFGWPANVRGLKAYLERKLHEIKNRQIDYLSLDFLKNDPPDEYDIITKNDLMELENVIERIMNKKDENFIKENLLDSILKPILSRCYRNLYQDQLSKTEFDRMAYKIIGINSDVRKSDNLYTYLQKADILMERKKRV